MKTINYKTKKKYKKLSFAFFILTILCAAFFFISLIIGVIYAIIGENELTAWIVLPLFIALIFNFIALHYQTKRIDYYNAIKRYRLYGKFNIVLDLLSNNKFEEASVIYNMIENNYMKDMLFGFYIGAALNSDRKEKYEKAKGIIDNLHKIFDPKQIIY